MLSPCFSQNPFCVCVCSISFLLPFFRVLHTSRSSPAPRGPSSICKGQPSQLPGCSLALKLTLLYTPTFIPGDVPPCSLPFLCVCASVLYVRSAASFDSRRQWQRAYRGNARKEKYHRRVVLSTSSAPLAHPPKPFCPFLRKPSGPLPLIPPPANAEAPLAVAGSNVCDTREGGGGQYDSLLLMSAGRVLDGVASERHATANTRAPST